MFSDQSPQLMHIFAILVKKPIYFELNPWLDIVTRGSRDQNVGGSGGGGGVGAWYRTSEALRS